MNEKAIPRSLWAFALTSLTTPFASVLLVELFSIDVKPGKDTKLGLLVALCYPACGYLLGTFHLAEARRRNRSVLRVGPLLYFLTSAIYIACSSQPPSPQLLGPLFIGFFLGSSILAEILRQLANSAGHSASAQIFVVHHLISLLAATSLLQDQAVKHLATWWLFTVFSYLFFWWES